MQKNPPRNKALIYVAASFSILVFAAPSFAKPPSGTKGCPFFVSKCNNDGTPIGPSGAGGYTENKGGVIFKGDHITCPRGRRC